MKNTCEGLEAEWGFLPLVMAKAHEIAYWGTVKWLTAYVSLQMTSGQVILTPYEMFQWCQGNVSGISFFYVSSNLLYIANHLSYKCCNDLNMYKRNELESTFIEIVNPKKSNIIVGVIYRYQSMDLVDFNCNYLNKLLDNISKEQKPIFLLGDFVNLLNYYEHNHTNEFLDSLASNSFIPLILQPTRITSHSNTLIDNIFSNVIDPDIIPGYLTASISDYLPQFSEITNTFGNNPSNKSNIYERDWYKFDRENFILEIFLLNERIC